MKKHIALLACFLIVFCITFSTGCVTNNQNIELADIDKTFEDDYPLLQQVTEYLTTLIEQKSLNLIIIENRTDIISVKPGDKITIEDEEIKNVLSLLFSKGYFSIRVNTETSTEPIIIRFHRWKKEFKSSYISGFAYAKNNKDKLSIQYIISQKELSIPDWYYYESDYEEWRLKKENTSTSLLS